MMKIYLKLYLETLQAIYLETLIMAKGFHLKKRFNSFTINNYSYNNSSSNKLVLNNY